MLNTPERLADAQRALLETTQNIGIRALEGASKLFELNVQAARTMLAAGTDRMSSMTQADPTQIAQAGAAAFSQPPDTAALAGYAQQLAEIVTSTNGEIARLLQQQAVSMQALMNELVSAAVPDLPRNAQTMPEAMRNPFEAVQRFFGPVPDAMTRTASSAMQAGGSTVRGATPGAPPTPTDRRP